MATDAFQSFEQAQQQSFRTKKWTRCDVEHCGRPAIGSLEFKNLCLDHFISHCYRRLDETSNAYYPDCEDPSSLSLDRFLQECIEQSADWVRPMRGLENLDRARLFDIFLWASDLRAKRELLKPISAPEAHS